MAEDEKLQENFALRVALDAKSWDQQSYFWFILWGP